MSSLLDDTNDIKVGDDEPQSSNPQAVHVSTQVTQKAKMSDYWTIIAAGAALVSDGYQNVGRARICFQAAF